MDEGLLNCKLPRGFVSTRVWGKGIGNGFLAVLQSPLFPLLCESKMGSAGCGHASSMP